MWYVADCRVECDVHGFIMRDCIHTRKVKSKKTFCVFLPCILSSEGNPCSTEACNDHFSLKKNTEGRDGDGMGREGGQESLRSNFFSWYQVAESLIARAMSNVIHPPPRSLPCQYLNRVVVFALHSWRYPIQLEHDQVESVAVRAVYRLHLLSAASTGLQGKTKSNRN